jgi:hypothetical protein
MFLDKFDVDGVMRGPAKETRGAFVSREDAARTAAAVLADPPGGTHDVTGRESLSLDDVARRFSALTHRPLRYQAESAKSVRDRLCKREPPSWRVDLSVEWFEAIAAGELEHTSNAVFRFTGKKPMNLEEYFTLFPELLQSLQRRITLQEADSSLRPMQASLARMGRINKVEILVQKGRSVRHRTLG